MAPREHIGIVSFTLVCIENSTSIDIKIGPSGRTHNIYFDLFCQLKSGFRQDKMYCCEDVVRSIINETHKLLLEFLKL